MIPLELKIFRFIQMGFYVQELFYLVFSKKRNLDFKVMVTHHFSVIILQLISYTNGFVLAGTMIETLHDVNDIFLHMAKMCNYMKEAGTHHTRIYDILSGLFFVTFFLSWFDF